MTQWKPFAAIIVFVVVAVACGGGPSPSYTTPTQVPRKSPQALYGEIHVIQDFIAKGRLGRHKHRPLKPRFITIHSTQNYSHSADVYAHARLLKRGGLKGTTWHYTVQENVAVQHLPLNEQGRHADSDGPGNNSSIGIEMCEHSGNDLNATIDRTARLAAFLMKQHNIPLRNVVPHHYWPREGANPPNKNCPKILMDNGRPGPKWRAFQNKVGAYYKTIS